MESNLWQNYHLNFPAPPDSARQVQVRAPSPRRLSKTQNHPNSWIKANELIPSWVMCISQEYMSPHLENATRSEQSLPPSSTRDPAIRSQTLTEYIPESCWPSGVNQIHLSRVEGGIVSLGSLAKEPPLMWAMHLLQPSMRRWRTSSVESWGTLSLCQFCLFALLLHPPLWACRGQPQEKTIGAPNSRRWAANRSCLIF